jgi:hypothetical protein
MWQSRHRRMLCWLVGMQALFPGRKTLEERARWPPVQMTVWYLRRLLKAAYWDGHLPGEWESQEALNSVPPPKDGVISLVGDGSHKPKRGTQNSLTQKGRISERHPWVFGMRFALLPVNWDVDRLPVALRLLRSKSPPAYQPENVLLRGSDALSLPLGPSESSSKARPPMALKPTYRWSCSATPTIRPGRGLGVRPGAAVENGRGENSQRLGDAFASQILSARPSTPPAGKRGLQNLLGV